MAPSATIPTPDVAPLPSLHQPRLHEKVALVTGASSGLGRAITLLYVSHGARLVVCADLKPDPSPGIDGETSRTTDEVSKRFGEGKAVYVHCDVGDGDSVRNAVQETVRLGGRLDM